MAVVVTWQTTLDLQGELFVDCFLEELLIFKLDTV